MPINHTHSARIAIRANRLRSLTFEFSCMSIRGELKGTANPAGADTFVDAGRLIVTDPFTPSFSHPPRLGPRHGTAGRWRLAGRPRNVPDSLRQFIVKGVGVLAGAIDVNRKCPADPRQSTRA